MRRDADAAPVIEASVIVPTFNRADLLARALESLAAQRLARDRFEVVVVNDCGLDPAGTVEAFADRLDVRLVTTPQNVGLAGARNVGVAASRGRFLSFLDDDDVLYPEHLELLLDAAIELGGETVVYSDAVKVVEDGSGEPLLRQMILAPATFSYDRLLLNNYIHAMSPLVPRVALDAVGPFDEELRALEDWELWLRIGARFAFHHVLRVTADYRVRAGAVNNTTRELPLHVRCTERIYERYPARPGTQLWSERTRYLEQHRRIAEQHAFRVTVLLAGATDDAAALEGAVEEVERVHGSDGVELVAYVAGAAADDERLRALVERLEGRFVPVTGGALAPEAAFALLERKAAGTRVERRLVTMAGAAGATPEAEDDYCIRAGYEIRPVPVYYADTPTNVTWQPDVYPEAARLARELGARTVVDLGSGNGDKLARLHPEFEIVGVDIGSNLEHVRRAHPQGTWVEHDFEEPGALPLDAELLDGCVIVCADVIEHLMRPEHLLAKLRDALAAGASAVLLSTPERTRTWGDEHAGPPPNTCHVREWTLEELGALLEREGFAWGDLELTRSNDAESRLATSLALLYRDEDVERRVRALRDRAAA